MKTYYIDPDQGTYEYCFKTLDDETLHKLLELCDSPDDFTDYKKADVNYFIKTGIQYGFEVSYKTDKIGEFLGKEGYISVSEENLI